MRLITSEMVKKAVRGMPYFRCCCDSAKAADSLNDQVAEQVQPLVEFVIREIDSEWDDDSITEMAQRLIKQFTGGEK